MIRHLVKLYIILQLILGEVALFSRAGTKYLGHLAFYLIFYPIVMCLFEKTVNKNSVASSFLTPPLVQAGFQQ